jgi:hypothetical protein
VYGKLLEGKVKATLSQARKISWKSERESRLRAFMLAEDAIAARDAAEPLLGLIYNTLARDTAVMPTRFPRNELAPNARPFADRALLCMSDVFGVADQMDYTQVNHVMFGLSQNDLWRQCLLPIHNTYALARLLIRSLDFYGKGAFSKQDVNPVLTILDDWVVGTKMASLDSAFVSFHDEDKKRVKETACRALFGSFWTDFHGIEHGAFVSSKTIIEDRPPFQPGLMPDQNVIVSCALPDLQT